jgi:cation diffusion facilitator CzcD-associated flavoprotein CzcO
LLSGWTKKFSEGKEIQQYYAKFAARRKLKDRTIFRTTVHEARWNEETFLWEITVGNHATGVQTRWIANILFDNGGGFHRPKYAAIPGRETFKGEQWHTGQWRTDADLTGKRVAIIGTGPSAAQVGPKIQPIVKKLYMYQRSCGHVLPRNNHVIPTWKKFVFRLFYPILWLYHMSWVSMVSIAGCRFAY